jgi:hypothetical protein
MHASMLPRVILKIMLALRLPRATVQPAIASCAHDANLEAKLVKANLRRYPTEPLFRRPLP